MSKLAFADHKNPALRFETLIAGAFDCGHKYCDPFDYAAQDYFNYSDEDHDRFERVKIILCTSLGVIAYRFSEGEHLENLKTLNERALNLKIGEDEELISIINESLELAKGLGI